MDHCNHIDILKVDDTQLDISCYSKFMVIFMLIIDSFIYELEWTHSRRKDCYNYNAFPGHIIN